MGKLRILSWNYVKIREFFCTLERESINVRSADNDCCFWRVFLDETCQGVSTLDAWSHCCKTNYVWLFILQAFNKRLFFELLHVVIPNSYLKPILSQICQQDT